MEAAGLAIQAGAVIGLKALGLPATLLVIAGAWCVEMAGYVIFNEYREEA